MKIALRDKIKLTLPHTKFERAQEIPHFELRCWGKKVRRVDQKRVVSDS